MLPWCCHNPWAVTYGFLKQKVTLATLPSVSRGYANEWNSEIFSEYSGKGDMVGNSSE